MLVLDAGQTIDTKRSLILAGGGMRVAYQAGVLIALEESSIKFSHVDGTSGGIFNTAMLASGQSAQEIAERWRSLKISQFASGRKFRSYLTPFSMSGYADADNIRKKVFPHLGIDVNAIRNNQKNATFNVCNFSDKTVMSITNKVVTEDHLIAGVSLPIFMPALQIGEDWYTDAVWIKDANLLEGVRQQSQELWLVWAIGNSRTYLPGAFNQYVHMIEMSANGALLEEYNQIKLVNSAIENNSGEYAQKSPIQLYLIKHQVPLPLDPDLFFNRINTRELINMGYENAKNYLSKSRVQGEKMDKNATRNQEAGDILSFRAVFHGKLKWNSMDSHVIYYSYFRYCQNKEQQNLYVFSSIYIAALAREIPAFEHEVNRTRVGDTTVLEIRAKILVNEEAYALKAVLNLSSPMDIFIGMEMKKVSLSIKKYSVDRESLVLQGNLFQSIFNRMKACFFANVRSEKGKAAGLKKRYEMISQLIANEI